MKTSLNNPGEISFADIIKLLAQRRRIIFQSVLVTLCAALLVTLLTKPTYRATTKILLKVEMLDPSILLPSYLAESLEQQSQILRSKPIISKALETITLANQKSDEEDSKSAKAPSIESVQKGLSINTISRTNILQLNVEHEDPLLTASLANAIVLAYSDYRSATKIKLIDEALHALGKELTVEKEQLRLTEKALEDYSLKEQIAILPESEIVTDLKRFAGFDAEVIAVDSDIKIVDTKLAEVKKQMRRRRPGDLVIPLIVEAPAIKGFQSKIRAAEVKLSDLLIEYTLEHPEVIAAQREIVRLKEDLENEVPKVIASKIGSYEMDKKLLEVRRDLLLKTNASYGARLNKVIFSQPKLAGFLNDVRTKRNIYQGLLNRQRELKIFKARSKRTPEVKIVEVARVPTRPIRPKPLLNTLLGLIIGLSIGCSIALLLPQEREAPKLAPAEAYLVGQERRDMIRAVVSTKVIYNIPGRPEIKHKCMSVNISGSGIRLITDERLAKAAALEMEISIPELKSIYAKGEVVWIAEVSMLENGKGPFGAGIRFTEISSDDQRTLLEYINKKITLSRRRNV